MGGQIDLQRNPEFSNTANVRSTDTMVHIHRVRRKSHRANHSGVGDEKKEPGGSKQRQQERRPFNTRLNADILLRAQQQCLVERCYMNDIIEQLLGLWLDGKIELPRKVKKPGDRHIKAVT